MTHVRSASTATSAATGVSCAASRLRCEGGRHRAGGWRAPAGLLPQPPARASCAGAAQLASAAPRARGDGEHDPPVLLRDEAVVLEAAEDRVYLPEAPADRSASASCVMRSERTCPRASSTPNPRAASMSDDATHPGGPAPGTREAQDERDPPFGDERDELPTCAWLPASASRVVAGHAADAGSVYPPPRTRADTAVDQGAVAEDLARREEVQRYPTPARRRNRETGDPGEHDIEAPRFVVGLIDDFARTRGAGTLWSFSLLGPEPLHRRKPPQRPVPGERCGHATCPGLPTAADSTPVRGRR
jgi:hypothetical protein